MPSGPSVDAPARPELDGRSVAADALERVGEAGLASIVRAWTRLPDSSRRALVTLAETLDEGPKEGDAS